VISATQGYVTKHEAPNR